MPSGRPKTLVTKLSVSSEKLVEILREQGCQIEGKPRSIRMVKDGKDYHFISVVPVIEQDVTQETPTPDEPVDEPVDDDSDDAKESE